MQASKGEIGYDSNENNILEPFNKLRQASSFSKIDAAVRLAHDLLKEEGSIVICETSAKIKCHDTLSCSDRSHVYFFSQLPALWQLQKRSDKNSKTWTGQDSCSQAKLSHTKDNKWSMSFKRV